MSDNEPCNGGPSKVSLNDFTIRKLEKENAELKGQLSRLESQYRDVVIQRDKNLEALGFVRQFIPLTNNGYYHIGRLKIDQALSGAISELEMANWRKRRDAFLAEQKEAGPAHELIEVLAIEKWEFDYKRRPGHTKEHFVMFSRGDESYHSDAPTFCRAVVEAFAKVRGIYKD